MRQPVKSILYPCFALSSLLLMVACGVLVILTIVVYWVIHACTRIGMVVIHLVREWYALLVITMTTEVANYEDTMSNKHKNQCNNCEHNNGLRCTVNRQNYYNHNYCDAKKQKYLQRVRMIQRDKSPIFYSDMER
jgi:hypothetical protein